MYLTFDEYKQFGGSLDEAAFNKYVYDAQAKIEFETHGRISEPTEAVKRCVTRLTDIFAKSDVSKDGVASFSHDGLSQTFVTSTPAELASAAVGIIKEYLAYETDENGVPLLYRGVSVND